MLLAFTILINSTIALVFKGFQRFKVNNLNAIVVNYFVCALTASLIFMRPVIDANVVDYPWFFPAVGLGALFIFIFNIVAQAVQRIGITLTTIFQKMSLVFPSIVGILFFEEAFGISKGFGILLAIVSIIMINMVRSNVQQGSQSSLRNWWHLAFLTLLGSGIIEVSLYVISAKGMSEGSNVSFTGSLFFFAGCFGLLFFIFKIARGAPGFAWKDLLWGTLLGIPNFFSIYWIMVMLENGMDGSTVFPILNVGIIVLNTFMGYFFFKETLSLFQWLGILAAIISIVLLIS